MYAIMTLLFVVMGFFALKVNYEEDITKFIPNTADSKNINAVFQNLKVKDNLVVLFTSRNGDASSSITVGDEFSLRLDSMVGSSSIDQIVSKVDAERILSVSDLIYDNLPVFLDSADYVRIESALQPDSLSCRLRSDYDNLLSPVGLFSKNFIFRDPIGMGNKALERLRTMQLSGNYRMQDEHIFSEDGKTMLVYVEPRFPAGNTNKNAILVDSIESLIGSLSISHPDVEIEYFGGPAVAVCNSRQIRNDATVTLGIAFLVIAVVILLSFRNKFSILLIFVPVVFGALFALSILYFLKGNISLIAVGAGSAIFGVVMSYSIHVVAHREHTHDAESVIREMAEPLTIGSFTTIGAFFSLVFTSSEVLRDFGWFASLTIIGTTVFCLVFLPHFLEGSSNKERSNRFLCFIEKINAVHYERSKILISIILILSCVGFYFANDVKFNSDMNSLSYQPTKLRKTEKRLDAMFQKEYKNIYFISVGGTEDEALLNYVEMNRKLDSLKLVGQIAEYANGEGLLISAEEQNRRLDRWNRFWTKERKAQLRSDMRSRGEPFNFTETSFAPFWKVLDKEYTPLEYKKEESASKVFSDWITNEADVSMALSQVRLKEESKADVYSQFKGQRGVVILDKPYFASSFVSSIKDDFYFVLFVSSFLVFLALLISYGRLELALLSFTPMALSWFIILGLMAIFGIEFNIVNIIISTFIFGIGDDFSIFVSDGLLSEYRTGKKMFTAHKTAIFFSAFTTIVGMGALAFAKHPAMQSVSFTSIIGMFAVVLIAYTLQPLIFDLFVVRRVRRGLFPWSLFSMGVTVFVFGTFVLLTLLVTVYASLLNCIPFGRLAIRRHLHSVVCHSVSFIMKIAFVLKKETRNEGKESFSKPAMIIANHQSVIDILQILALSPKVIMITKNWVWRSPLLGCLVRMVDFHNISDGYEVSVDVLRKRVAEGYSIAVFPEGTRSSDGELRRFHKGAFFLAEKLHLDILPIVMTGNAQALVRSDLMLRRAHITLDILPRIKADDYSWGETYQQRRTSVSRFFKGQYAKRVSCNENVDNPFYFYQLTRNFIYKGPVVEWYMRVKVAMEKNYRTFDEMIPRNARITDIGCGYGFLPYMLAFVGRNRRVVGIDYDEEKIAVADHCFSKTENLSFVATNAITYDLPESDVFVLNDMLHYLPYEKQCLLIENCMRRLADDGMIVIRDGDSSKMEKHEVTKMTEIFSTKIFKFNKTEGTLFFTSFERINEVAAKNGFSVDSHDNDHYTSNTIFILRRIR
ncbi:MAG: MMPL family transporter [Prevotellaceae bacterium]|nr:MMPL family transporter [Prevotellaceae bacterium]